MSAKSTKEKAIAAIDEVFGDTSVSKETTLELLEEIFDCVEGKVELLRRELRE